MSYQLSYQSEKDLRFYLGFIQEYRTSAIFLEKSTGTIYDMIKVILTDLKKKFNLAEAAFFYRESDYFKLKLLISRQKKKLGSSEIMFWEEMINQSPDETPGFNYYMRIKIDGKLIGLIGGNVAESEMIEHYQVEAWQAISIYINQIMRMQNAIFELAYIDAKTGIMNPKYLADMESRLFRRRCAIAMLDIDFFKNINTRYGHLFADEILNQFGQFLKNKLRESDVKIRHGGEEFLIILNETSLEEAKSKIDSLRMEFSRKIFRFEDKDVLVTFSAGISLMEDDPVYFEKYINQADQALNLAKEQGRNLVLCFQK